MHFPNDFMSRGANAAKKLLDESSIKNIVVKVEKDQVNFESLLSTYQADSVDAYVMFGYKAFGFACKQARDMGITAPFFGSTTLLDPAYHDNSEGTLIGSEFPFFVAADGNYVLGHQFLKDYETMHGKEPNSVWPPMQAFDAMNLAISQIRTINESKTEEESFDDWLRKKLYRVRYHQGVCGNLAITEDGSSKGIYFSMYKFNGPGEIEKIQ